MRPSVYGLIVVVCAFGCAASAASPGGSGGGYAGAGGYGVSTTAATTGGPFATTAANAATTGGAFPASSSMSVGESTASSAASSSSGGSGDCQSDSDCPGGSCVALTPGGYRVCVVPPVQVTTCMSSSDQCCPQTQNLCAAGAPCYAGPLVPLCTGGPTTTHNQCGVDQCAKDLDCAPGQICAPAGALGFEIRACFDAYCKVDADCTAHAGGVCAPVQDPCCMAPAGLFCTYPGSGGCRATADCPPDRYCAPDATSGVASCQNGGPLCAG